MADTHFNKAFHAATSYRSDFYQTSIKLEIDVDLEHVGHIDKPTSYIGCIFHRGQIIQICNDAKIERIKGL